MAIRMRLVGWNVQPVVMADDGENLTAAQVQGQMIPAAQWGAFKNGGDAEALEGVRVQIERQPGTEPQLHAHEATT